MAEMELTLRQLSYLTRLEEKASFTLAAETLGITQPALSIAIGQLEEALGVALVERGTRPVKLTEFGEITTACARRTLRDIRQTREEITAKASGRIGRLDICMAPSGVGLAVSKVLTEMVDELPHLEIRIGRGVLPAVADRLHSGEFSVFLGTSSESDRDATLDILHIKMVDMLVVTGAGHALASKRTVRLADLTKHPWIQIGDIDANLPGWRKAFVSAGLTPPRLAVDIRNLGLVRDMLLQNTFATVLPQPLVQADIEAGLLKSVTPKDLVWSFPFDAVTSKLRRPPAAVALFLNRLLAATSA